MSPWFIFTLVLGPLVVFTVWVVITQLRGRFRNPKPKRNEPDFFQRHATLIIFIVAAGWSFLVHGFPGLIAAVIVVFSLSLFAAAIMTALEGRKHRSQRKDSEVGESEVRLDPFARRFVRNFRSALPELMSYVS